MTTERLIAGLRAIVGDEGLILDDHAMQPYLISWRDNWRGRVPAVVRPRTTDQVAAVVRACAHEGKAIVPQGGHTGVTGASQPHDDGSEIVLSLERMNAIRAIDADNDTMTVEAGCVLADVRAAAERADRLFPLLLGAVGSCMIGGNISTNAGGVNVIRYGNTRNLVAGLEVVLPDGEVWDGLRGLRKDNAGYDLKQLFIGAEGTLGVITAAVVRLFPKPRAEITAFVAVPSPQHALRWLVRAKDAFAEQLTAFELIQDICIEVTCRRIPGLHNPLRTASPWYVLMEVSGQGSEDALRAALEDVLAAGLEAGELTDATIAASGQQRDMLWRLRESIPEAHKHEGVSFKHDISVPISRVPEFLTRIEDELDKELPGLRMFTFGHLGDGNLHFNPLLPAGAAAAPGDLQRVNTAVHDLVTAFGGSISAEHGIGRLRLDELTRYKSPVELRMMAALKQLFDPHNVMNPGKLIVPPAPAQK
ncbi:MAG TPA: FAD-binding oxidoreductase [Pseudolabrys sp.]|nr:FAD-binding oxidoreductase [Pseudolabrys sp.]